MARGVGIEVTDDTVGGLTLGTNLSLSGATLNAAGGSASGLVSLFDSTLSVDTATIDTGAGGIASGHGALIILLYLRTDEAVNFSTFTMTLNNDASAVYDRAFRIN